MSPAALEEVEGTLRSVLFLWVAEVGAGVHLGLQVFLKWNVLEHFLDLPLKS